MDDAVGHMKDPVNLLGKPNLTKHEMQEVSIHSLYTFYTREDTERLVKILEITYKGGDIDKAAPSTAQLNIK